MVKVKAAWTLVRHLWPILKLALTTVEALQTQPNNDDKAVATYALGLAALVHGSRHPVVGHIAHAALGAAEAYVDAHDDVSKA